MTLIIAEKPSLGRNIAAALGANTRGEGYLSGAGYIVTWAFGHLFSLADVEAYSDSPNPSVRWTLDNLPCFPKTFQFQLRPKQTKGKSGKRTTPDAGVKKQFECIRNLCRRADVDTIVNAGDADREGEIIVRLILDHAVPHTDKPLFRLWLPDQTAETIRAAAAALQPETAYDSLANEGFARTYIDWLYGVNLTRYASIRTGKLLRVGRVIVPIVKAIYDRDMAIRNFVPKPYMAVISREKTKGSILELVSKTQFDATDEGRAAARALCERYNAGTAIVSSLKKKQEIIPPGKLYSLSKLQNVLGKKFKMSMDKSLSILQKLYEAGYVTYPRTNSEYLASAEKDKMKKILEGVKTLGYPVIFKDKKTIFDDTKIESHSALTPTFKIPSKEKLSEEEMQVYSTIFRRFAAVFCSVDCKAEKTEMCIDVKEGETLLERFTLRGTVILEPGWMKYDDAPRKFQVLPPIGEGDAVNILFKPVEKATEPPKHYTIETLNNYMKNPFKEEKAAGKRGDAELMAEHASDADDYRAMFEGVELGTEATRTGIIDNARKSGYIKLSKDVYTILPDGEFLMEALMKMQITMDKYKTSELGRSLKRVFHGEDTVEACVALAEREIQEIFDKQGETAVERVPYQPKKKRGGKRLPVLRVGKCPLCGNDIVRGNFAYGCMGYQNGCAFQVGLTVCGREIRPEEIQILLETGKTPLLKGLISKKQKPFSAYLSWDTDHKKVVFSFEERMSSEYDTAADVLVADEVPLPETAPPILNG